MNAPVIKLQNKKTAYWNRALVTLTCLSILAAFFWGIMRESENVNPHLRTAFPEAEQFENQSPGNFIALQDGHKIGYVTLSEAHGYGGPLRIAVGVDLKGVIVNLSMIKQRETPSWYQRILDDGFINIFKGKKVTDLFQIGDDVDAVSGATSTSRGITQAVQSASWDIGRDQLKLSVPKQQKPDIQFGLPEIVLGLLILLWLVSKFWLSRHKKHIRWLSLLVSMVTLGFIYDSPLTLSFVNKMLLGYWPDWQNHLYWYMLIAFIVTTFIWNTKSVYCRWICPFGTAQECINILGGAKSRNPLRFKSIFTWTQRSLTWAAILLALIYRNPGMTSYEIFGSLFELQGSTFQFILLAMVMIASVFIKRPWCRYLCPLPPIYDFFKHLQNKAKGKWNKIITN